MQADSHPAQFMI